ncbi:MAG: 3'(2'),5'-bisphosphate nucleotidase CysQ [Candidatus Sericytochromatia bacterium]
MSAVMHHFERELDITREVAQKAGEIILSFYDTDYVVQMKTGQEPVTIADKTSSRFIVEALQKSFPRDLVVSEESEVPGGVQSHDRIWIIDPVDGTKEFIKHNGEFSVMIGLVEEGVPVVGVVYQPVTGYLYWASRGQGAFSLRDQLLKPLQVSQRQSFHELCIAASRSHLTQELCDLYERLGITEIIRSGSVGLKLAMIAHQTCDLYLNLSGMTSCWDTCAPEIILKEAGGRVSNLSGTPLDYSFQQIKNHNGVVASNGIVHDRLLERIHTVLEGHYFAEIERVRDEDGLTPDVMG